MASSSFLCFLIIHDSLLLVTKPSHAFINTGVFLRTSDIMHYLSFHRAQSLVADLKKVEDHRRKWDADEYERIAASRLQEELEAQEKAGSKQPPVRRELLKQRDYRIDLESKLGKSVVITKNTPSSQTGGYYCNVCDCVVKDSINFLDHINGKKHQRNLGMSMRVERSSLDQVKKRFEINKKKMEEKKKTYDLESRVKELKEEEEKLKEYRKDKKKERKRKLNETDFDDESDQQSELASIMGFSGFGGGKR